MRRAFLIGKPFFLEGHRAEISQSRVKPPVIVKLKPIDHLVLCLTACRKVHSVQPLDLQRTEERSRRWPNSRPFGSPDKPHRLLLEFQRVLRPNQSCHLKPSKADPTQSALGDVFRGQDHCSGRANCFLCGLGYLSPMAFAKKRLAA